MAHSGTDLWEVVLQWAPKGRWLTLQDLYSIIEAHVDFGSEDLLPEGPNLRVPKWKKRLRSVLGDRKRTGRLNWDGEGRYMIPRGAR